MQWFWIAFVIYLFVAFMVFMWILDHKHNLTGVYPTKKQWIILLLLGGPLSWIVTFFAQAFCLVYIINNQFKKIGEWYENLGK